MALETVVYPQENSFLGNNWEYYNIVEENNNNHLFLEGSSANSNSSGCCRKKRKRTCNNKNQRMIHIAVERNRRKQMNQYLTLLRSLMPSSYVQRADQASIIGGAINFVKELEHNLQTLQAQKTLISQSKKGDISSSSLFGDFFSFPLRSNYSRESSTAEISRPSAMTHEIQVNLAENYVNLKILSKRRPKQLMNIVVGLQNFLWLTILHLNVTTIGQMVLYSISAELEEGCQLTTVEEISQAVNQLLGRIQEEEASTSN